MSESIAQMSTSLLINVGLFIANGKKQAFLESHLSQSRHLYLVKTVTLGNHVSLISVEAVQDY